MPEADDILPRFRRAAARKAGLMYYFTGKPCPKGHVTYRLTKTAHCIECDVLKRQAYKAKNLAHWHDKYDNDPEFRASQQKRIRERWKDPKFREYRREYHRRRYKEDLAFREIKKLAAIANRKNGGHRWSTLGVSREKFTEMLASQNNLCAICGNALDGGKETHLDHHPCPVKAGRVDVFLICSC